MAKKPYADVTGKLYTLLPPGDERDEMMMLMRFGIDMKRQHIGKRPGRIFKLVLECARRAGPPYTFNRLLNELELEAIRRDGRAPIVENVDRIRERVILHLPKEGEATRDFSTLRNHLTRAKNILDAQIHTPPNQ